MDNILKPLESVLLWVFKYEHIIKRVKDENSIMRAALEKSQHEARRLEQLVYSIREEAARIGADHIQKARELDSVMKDNAELLMQMKNHQEEMIQKTADDECLLSQCRHRNLVLENQLEHTGEEVHRLHHSLNEYKEKYQGATDRVGQLTETLADMEQRNAALTQKDCDREQLMACLHEHTMSQESSLKALQSKHHRSEEVITHLTEEMCSRQVELDDATDNMAAAHREISRCKAQLGAVQAELSSSEDSKDQVAQELHQLQEKCTILVEKYLEQEEHLRELEFSGEELRAEGQLKSRQLLDVQATVTHLKADLSNTQEQRNLLNNELSKLRQCMKNLKNTVSKKEEAIKGLKSKLYQRPASPHSSPLFSPCETPRRTPTSMLCTPRRKMFCGTPRRVPDSPCTPVRLMDSLDDDVLEGHGEAQINVLLYSEKWARSAL